MLIINNFQNGQSASPYVGNGAFWKSANLDVSGQYGIARINWKPALASASSSGNELDELPGGFTQYDSIPYFTTLGNSIFSMSIGASDTFTILSSGRGYFCEVWKGYVISVTNTNLYAKKIATGVETLLNSNLQNTSHHKIFYSRNDGKLYIANGRYVAVLEEVATKTFDPTDPATFSITLDAFKSPNEYGARAINELGTYLVICAIYGTANFSHTAYFLWDGTTDNTPEAIYEIKEQDMATTLNHKNHLYITGGNNGNIYMMTTAGIEHFTRLPFDYDNNANVSLSYFHRNQLAWWDNKLMVGVGSWGANRIIPAGIYSVSDNGKINCEFLISNGEDATNKEVLIGGLLSYDSDTLIYGWRTEVSGSKEYGVDVVKTTNNRVPSYACYLESLLYPVGTKLEPKSYDRTEIILSRPLQSGEGIRIKYRQDISSNWITLDTRDYSTDGAVSVIDMSGVHNLQNIQLRIELTTGSSSRNTPFLREVRLV